MSVNLPDERPLGRGPYCYCDGPLNFASTQVQRFEDRWVCWVATDGMRYGKVSEIGGFSDQDGSANELFTSGERPGHLSFCFDQDARPVIAIQQNGTTIELRRKVAGVVTAYVWTGNSPQLFYNGIVVEDTGDSDVVCFYIKPAGDTIFARFQRDNFATEYAMNSITGLTLSDLFKADRTHVAGQDFCILYGIDSAGQQVVYKSEAFPPFRIVQLELSTLSVAFQSGNAFSTTILVAQGTEKATGALAFGSGIYFDVVIGVDQGMEKATETLAFSTGSHTLTVLVADQGTEKATGAVAFGSGDYHLEIVSGGSFPEKCTGTVLFQSGIYS